MNFVEDAEASVLFLSTVTSRARARTRTSDPFHTGSSTGNFPGFFDFWYCRTNSVRSESFSDSAAGENPYCRFCTFAKLIFATSQTCRIIPQISPFLPSEKAQLVSLAEIAISLQIKRPIGRHRSVRTVRSIQIFPVGSIQIFEICDKCVQKISWNQKSGEKPPLIIAHSPLTNSAHFRIPTFRCGMGLSSVQAEWGFPLWYKLDRNDCEETSTGISAARRCPSPRTRMRTRGVEGAKSRGSATGRTAASPCTRCCCAPSASAKPTAPRTAR